MAKVELAKAYVSVIPSFDGATDAITSGLTGAVSGTAATAAGKASGTSMASGILTSIGAALPGGMGATVGKAGTMAGTGVLASMSAALAPAAVAAAAIGITKGLYDLGSTWDAAFDTMRAGTGATGETLAGLEQSLKNVVGTVPNEIGDVSEAMAELNTRTGATGSTLEGLTTQFMALENLGYSTDIDKATGMMAAWGVETEDMSGRLDQLFLVSQSTGIGMDSLTSAMSANAESMQILGFSFEQTAAMAGQFDKAGLDASSMMGKLSKACVSLAKDGEQPAEAYKRIVGEMEDFIKTGDQASALNLATELFGTKGAAQFLQAIETGAMDFDALAASIAGAEGAIQSNEKANRSAAESWQVLTNRASALLEPLGSAVFGAAADAMQGILDVIDLLTPGFEQFSSAVMENEALQGVLAEVSTVASGAFDALQGAVSAVTTALGLDTDGAKTLGDIAGGVLSVAIRALVTPFEIACGAVQGMISAVTWCIDKFNEFRNAAQSVWNAVTSIFSGSINFPHINMPHFWVNGGEAPWGIGGMGSLPSFGIDWYAKGGMFDKPEIIGVGEAGTEYVLNEQQIDELSDRLGSKTRSEHVTNININIARFENRTDEDAESLMRRIADGVNMRLRGAGASL